MTDERPSTVIRGLATLGLSLVLAAGPLAACAQTESSQSAASQTAVPVQSYEVVKTYPHDPGAFTQGLIYRDGQLIESTGRFPSTLRIVRLEDGVVLKKRELDGAYFGEGIVDWDDRLISLTWRNGVGFVWNIDDLSPVSVFRYPGEGWALTRDAARIIMSDGTDQLRFLDPETLAETGRIRVTADGVPVTQINELEWVRGEVWANIWQDNRIARIDPATGHVVAWIDMSGIFTLTPDMDPADDVLNGIAWDRDGDRIFVTGKHWPSLFEIRVIDPATTDR